MKRTIAVILFSIFFCVTAVPAVTALVTNATSVLIMDEDKSPSASEEVKKDNKIFPFHELQLLAFAASTTNCLHSEKIEPAPFMEIPGLPPDFC